MSMESNSDPVALFREREEKRAANNPDANVDERVEQDIIREIRDGNGSLEQKQNLYNQLSPEARRSTPISPELKNSLQPSQEQLQKQRDALMESMWSNPTHDTQDAITKIDRELENRFAVDPLYKRLGKDDPNLLNARREKLVSKMLSEPDEATQTEIRDIDDRLNRINSPKPTESQDQPLATPEAVKNELPLPPEWDLLDEDEGKADIVITQKEFATDLETSKKEGLMEDVSSEELNDQEPVDRRHSNVRQVFLSAQQNDASETISRHTVQNESRPQFVSDTDANEYWKSEQAAADEGLVNKTINRFREFIDRHSDTEVTAPQPVSEETPAANSANESVSNHVDVASVEDEGIDLTPVLQSISQDEKLPLNEEGEHPLSVDEAVQYFANEQPRLLKLVRDFRESKLINSNTRDDIQDQIDSARRQLDNYRKSGLIFVNKSTDSKKAYPLMDFMLQQEKLIKLAEESLGQPTSKKGTVIIRTDPEFFAEFDRVEQEIGEDFRKLHTEFQNQNSEDNEKNPSIPENKLLDENQPSSMDILLNKQTQSVANVPNTEVVIPPAPETEAEKTTKESGWWGRLRTRFSNAPYIRGLQQKQPLVQGETIHVVTTNEDTSPNLEDNADPLRYMPVEGDEDPLGYMHIDDDSPDSQVSSTTETPDKELPEVKSLENEQVEETPTLEGVVKDENASTSETPKEENPYAKEQDEFLDDDEVTIENLGEELEKHMKFAEKLFKAEEELGTSPGINRKAIRSIQEARARERAFLDKVSKLTFRLPYDKQDLKELYDTTRGMAGRFWVDSSNAKAEWKDLQTRKAELLAKLHPDITNGGMK